MPNPEKSNEFESSARCADAAFEAIRQIGVVMGLSVDRADFETSTTSDTGLTSDLIARLIGGASLSGILVSETPTMTHDDVESFLGEGYPVIIIASDTVSVSKNGSDRYTNVYVLEKNSGRNVEGVQIGETVKRKVLTAADVKKLFSSEPPPIKLLCKKELECDSISAASIQHDTHHHADGHAANGHHHAHPKPVSRFIGLLKLDLKDILSVVLFAFVAGTLAMATPLAVESLVNVVSWGTYLQPLVVLGLMLLTCLGIAGFLGILQVVVVELIQRRQYVRIVGDLAHRFPRANQASLEGEYPREMANRIFDIMTIQKASAVLLLDGVSIVLTTTIGLVLLAFYHPFLLGFDIVLLISMVFVTRILGRGGIRTSIAESYTKYRVAHWLQDVLASPGVFKIGGGESLSIQRANELTASYLRERQRQFRVVIRQVAFAVILEVIASTAVLVLGGWLVIDGQLTLGQLVASELVVTVVVGAFAKAGKSLEKFYDLMAGIDKVGHLIDIPADPRHETYVAHDGPVAASWTKLVFSNSAYTAKVDAATIEPGSRTAIVGNDADGRSLLVRAIAGLSTVTSGSIRVAGSDPLRILPAAGGRLVGYVGDNDIFHGTLRENVDLARSGIGHHHVRKALEDVGLSDVVLHLKDGMETQLQTGGYPLSHLQSKLLILARAIVSEPKFLIIDGLLDELSQDDRLIIWTRLTAPDAPWTLVVNTNRDDVASLCDSQLSVRRT